MTSEAELISGRETVNCRLAVRDVPGSTTGHHKLPCKAQRGKAPHELMITQCHSAELPIVPGRHRSVDSENEKRTHHIVFFLVHGSLHCKKREKGREIYPPLSHTLTSHFHIQRRCKSAHLVSTSIIFHIPPFFHLHFSMQWWI